ncbi:hypothetical protein FZEAL_6829 [Fusarium zealandicum]|uniref:Zn(2)-C6 fungal-type domain-containing protein n=1 Tax=Fusarium zealandicum TaxID=1053134 RepID=A0A8H4XJ30_9HYPO|nr:hypothetical protein FZEAL_6829 [Fusarium zealandicum]
MAQGWIKDESASPPSAEGEGLDVPSPDIFPTTDAPSSRYRSRIANSTSSTNSTNSTTTTTLPLLGTQPHYLQYPAALNTFNLDSSYAESSSSNVSPASTSTPATPTTAGTTDIAANSDRLAASATGTASSAAASSASSASGSAPSQYKDKAKRIRTSKPKVKTGCTNCKQRRIKCDEARPACSQCVRSNKACTGYPPPSRGSRPFEEIRIAPKPIAAAGNQASCSNAESVPFQSDFHLPPHRARQRMILRAASPRTPSPSPSIYQPSLSLQVQPHEAPYFDLFRSHTASELSGFFDNSFWTCHVLQQCHSEDAIKCAVIALGALYQTLEQTAETSLHARPGLSADARLEAVRRHWQVAIKRYSDACNALVKLNSQDQRSHKVLIMANVLLACFDSFIGDHRQAIHQIQTGLSLVNGFCTQHSDRLLTTEDPLEEELATIFTRLAIQAKSYDMAFHFAQPFRMRLGSQAQPQSPDSSRPASPHEEPWSIPDIFTSVFEARRACDELNARIMRYIEGLFAIKSDLKGTLPQLWRDYGLGFKSQIETWYRAFDSIFRSRHNPSVSPQEKAGIAALKMLATSGQVLYLMMFSDKESDFDTFMPHFQTMVKLGYEIVSDEERRAASRICPNPEQCQHHPHGQWNQGFFSGMGFSAPHIKPRFSADLGVVAPLFVVATKCRDPSLRRQAIQLLRSSARREGMWDSEMAAHISTWVMNLEESDALAMGVESLPIEGSATPVPRTIPEEKRVMIRSVEFDLRARVAELQVGTRGLQPDLPDPKFRQTRLTW